MRYLLGNIWVYTVTFGWLAAAWRWGDWRNWRGYYPTVLYVIGVQLVVSILTYEYSLWYFRPALFVPNHTVADFLIAFTNFPPITLLYLSRYPSQATLPKQLLYVLAWTVGQTGIEALFLLTGMLSYHNGWHLGWSMLLWFCAFLLMRLHALQPLWAWLAVGACAVAGSLWFHIPVAHLK